MQDASIQPEVKAVRLAMSPEHHRLLRLIAADQGTSMASVAHDVLVEYVERETRTRKLKR